MKHGIFLFFIASIFSGCGGINYYIRDKSTFLYPVITNGNGTTIDMYAYSVAFIN